MRHLPHTFRSAQQGVAAIELALVGMLLVTVLLGASEFGRAMYQYNTVVKGVRAAARYLSNYASTDVATRGPMAKNLVVYGSTATGISGTELVPGLSTSMVNPTYTPSGGVSQVKVEVTGLTFQPLASWILPDFTFAPIAATITQGT